MRADRSCTAEDERDGPAASEVIGLTSKALDGFLRMLRLWRVDANQAYLLARDELDRVAVDHAGDDRTLARRSSRPRAGGRSERGESRKSEQEQEMAGSNHRAADRIAT